jgi:uncharacterized RDD family membrane protein YckC
MTPQTYFCSECGRPAAAEDLARFGDRLICPYCKNAYAQKLREGVAPAGYVQYGGFWLRFVAIVIDGLILWIPSLILRKLVAAATGFGPYQPSPMMTPAELLSSMGAYFFSVGMLVQTVAGTVLACSYETFFIVRFGATPGKMALGLKVVRPDGSGIQVGRAIGRYFAKALNWFTLCIGFIMAGVDTQKRGLHDMICDTRVIKTRG